MHITPTLDHLLGGRSRNLVATLVVAFCAALALTVSTPASASAARPAAPGSLPDLSSARGAGPDMPSGKTRRGELRTETEKSATLFPGVSNVLIQNCHFNPVDIWSWDYTTGGGWRYRETVPPGCGFFGGGPIFLEDGHTYALAATDQFTGALIAMLDPVQGGTTLTLFWTIP